MSETAPEHSSKSENPVPTTRVYAARFKLPRETNGQSTMVVAANAAWRWATRNETEEWAIGERRDGERIVRAVTVTKATDELRRLVLSHPDSDDPSVAWRVTVDILLTRRGIEVACLLGRRDPTFAGQLQSSHVTIPRVVRALVALGATNGGLDLSEAPTRLHGSDQIQDFVEGALLDTTRSIPIVLFSPGQDGAYVPGAEAIDALAFETVGVAKVFYLGQPDDTFLLSNRIGRYLSVWDGAVRIYWPNFGVSSSAYDHPLLTRSRIGPWVVERMRRDLISRAVERFVRPAGVAELLTHFRTERERQDLMNRLEAAEGEAALISLYETEIEKLNSERDRLTTDLEQRDADIKALTRDLGRQSDEIRQLKYQLRLGRRGAVEPEESVEWPVPETLIEAVLQAEEAFPDTLVLTKRAIDAAGRMNAADNSPSKLWRLFVVLDEVCGRWRSDSLGTSMQIAFQERGVTLKGVSDSTVGRYPDSYCFTHNGQRVAVGPHAEISRGERIYWYADEDERQFVINHIGQHLPDSTT